MEKTSIDYWRDYEFMEKCESAEINVEVDYYNIEYSYSLLKLIKKFYICAQKMLMIINQYSMVELSG